MGERGMSNDLVFKGLKYGAWQNTVLLRWIHDAGINKHITFHSMRHTYATMMLMVGMNPAFCAKQLGHSVEMFHQHYAKWLDGDQNDLEMARLESSLLAPENTRDKIKGT